MAAWEDQSKMISVAVTGANGFIGRRFLQTFSEHFSFKGLVRTQPEAPISGVRYFDYDLADGSPPEDALAGCEAVVHAAYDERNLNANLTALKALVNSCQAVGVRRFIFLSTVSVYDPDGEKIVEGQTPYSRGGDPYTATKRRLEQYLTGDCANKQLEVVILQPTIVYGFGSVWSRIALEASSCDAVFLPDAGQLPCNCVYVDDVCGAIAAAIQGSYSAESSVPQPMLVTGPAPRTWANFIASHQELLDHFTEAKKPNIESTPTARRYSDSLIKNIIFSVIYHPAFMGIPGQLASRHRKPKQGGQKLSLRAAISKAANSTDGQFTPSGLGRVAMSSRFRLSPVQLKESFDYEPRFNLEDGMRRMQEQLGAEGRLK